MILLAGIFGTVRPPDAIKKWSPTGEVGGLFLFLNTILKLMIYGAGIYALFNFIFAGWSFMSSGGDAQKMEKAWGLIWQSLLGLLVAAGSFVLAAVVGLIIFGDAKAIIVPKLYKPQ
jgi:hypothetical protein